MTSGDTVHIVQIVRRKAFYEGRAQIVKIHHSWIEGTAGVVDADVRFSDGCVERRRVYDERQVYPEYWVSQFNKGRR